MNEWDQTRIYKRHSYAPGGFATTDFTTPFPFLSFLTKIPRLPYLHTTDGLDDDTFQAKDYLLSLSNRLDPILSYLF